MTDTQCEEHVIESVQERDNGWEVIFDECYCWVPKPSPVEPKPGRTIRQWGRGIGYLIRGIAIDGEVVFYRSERQQAELSDRQRVQSHASKVAEFEQHETEIERRILALPEPLRRRIDRFRDNRPSFHWELMPYELFCCEEAAKIAAEFKTTDAIQSWADLAYNEQKAAMPSLSGAHSGNTFGMSVRLAYLLAENRDDDIVQHWGALSPLVGSDAYEAEVST